MLSNNSAGDAMVVELQPGRELFGTMGNFVACTNNITIERSFNVTANLYGTVTPIVFKNTSDVPALLLLKGNGGMSRLEVAEGDKLFVDQTSWVSSEKEPVARRVGSKSGIKSFLFGGEGFVFAFEGPQVVHVQTVVKPPGRSYVQRS